MADYRNYGGSYIAWLYSLTSIRVRDPFYVVDCEESLFRQMSARTCIPLTNTTSQNTTSKEPQ